jgi:hypothetical protein
MAQHSAQDQYLLELVNRARLDPGGEAARYGVDLGSITAASKQPLAGNTDLGEAAEGHSQWMLETDTFSHTGAGGSSAGQRMAAAGYTFTGSWAWGENIAWKGTTLTPEVTQFVADVHANLFRSPGHRSNMLNETFREAGIGVETGRFGSYNAVMATENFGRSGAAVFFTGVAFNDTDGSGFYTPGEGRGGVRVDLDSTLDSRAFTTTTATAGGYEVGVTAGTYDVTFSGDGLDNALKLTLSVGAENVKLDMIGSDSVASSASLAMGAHLKAATLLGTAALTATGNGLANGIAGNRGDNVLNGGAGADTLEGGAGNDIFVLRPGEANGDRILDFTGNGSGAGDVLRFEGYGSGAAVTQTSDGRWQVSDGVRTDVFTVNGQVHGSDYVFEGSPPPPGGDDPVDGTAGPDSLVGSAGADTLGGGGGADTVRGYAGEDWLYGGSGADSLLGGKGGDVLVGGGGADQIRGAGGADRMLIRDPSEGGDWIFAFDAIGGDRLDLRPLFQASGLSGTDPLGDGYLRLVQSGDDVLVRFDGDGDGANVVLLATITDSTVAALGGDFFLA